MLPDRKVLVTGANGLLGANVVAQLLKKGYLVRAMVRRDSDRKALNDLHCELFEGDITNIYDLERAVKPCRYVVHCAANTKQYSGKWDEYRRVNIEGTALLVEVCKKCAIERFIFVSTSNCFTNGSMADPGNENSCFQPWLRGSGYAYSKYLAQTIVLNEVRNSSFPAVVVAPTFMIGPRDARPSSGKLFLYGLRNRVVFYPPGGKNFVDAEYVAEAICYALTKGRTGSTYLLSGRNMTYRHFFARVRRLSGRAQLHIAIPRWLLVLSGYACEGLTALTGFYLPLNRVNQKLLCLDNYFSNSKAKAELNLRPTNITSALYKARQWFTENNYLK